MYQLALWKKTATFNIQRETEVHEEIVGATGGFCATTKSTIIAFIRQRKFAKAKPVWDPIVYWYQKCTWKLYSALRWKVISLILETTFKIDYLAIRKTAEKSYSTEKAFEKRKVSKR